jgi:hypothetical protein
MRVKDLRDCFTVLGNVGVILRKIIGFQPPHPHPLPNTIYPMHHNLNT